jgi:hypothetical protein
MSLSTVRGAFNRSVITALKVAFSFLAEKNQLKADCVDAPFVLSLTRLTIASLVVSLNYRIIHTLNLGWPEGALGISLVLSLPILRALDSATTAQVLDVAKVLLSRFGVGDVSQKNACVPHEWASGDPDAGDA